MRDYPINHDQLHRFSQSIPYENSDSLLDELDQLKSKLNFPAISNDVGSVIRFILSARNVQKIFEFGSGYGHSLYWYLNLKHIRKIVLTEKRQDLQSVFGDINWPIPIKEIVEYHQGDAFDRFSQDDELYDFILIDGVKAQYKSFLEVALNRLTINGVIAIDNSYWRGSFLDEELMQKQSARSIKQLHDYIKTLDDYEKVFIPFIDGLTLIQRKSL